MGSKTGVTTRCIVVAKDCSSESVMASVVPVRGSSNEFPAKRINALKHKLGLKAQDLVLRSDQEPAILRGLFCGIVSFERGGRKRCADC